MTSETFDYTDGTEKTWTCPAAVFSIQIEGWGSGGGGGSSYDYGTGAGGGGGGGGYGKLLSFSVVPGTQYKYLVGRGGQASLDDGVTGATTYFEDSAGVSIFSIPGGAGGKHGGVAYGGDHGHGSHPDNGLDIHNTGGDGYGYTTQIQTSGGGGGEGASLGGNGTTATGQAGASGTDGGNGGSGGNYRVAGNNGDTPGGGGGGGGWSNSETVYAGGSGGDGRIVITYASFCPSNYFNLNKTYSHKNHFTLPLTKSQYCDILLEGLRMSQRSW